MSYGFEIIDSEDQMKYYFKGVSGKHIKDTLSITIRNTGVRKGGINIRDVLNVILINPIIFSKKLRFQKTCIQMGDWN